MRQELQTRISTLIVLHTYPTPDKAMGASREQIAQTVKQAGLTTVWAVSNRCAMPLYGPFTCVIHSM